MFSQEDFIQNLYGYTDEQMKEIYGVQTEDKKSLFDEIGSILLAYTIVDSILKLTKIEQNGLYNKLSKKILSTFRRESKLTEKKVANILKDTLKKSNEFYNKDSKNDFMNKDVDKIINKRYKGSTFSKRIWENNNEISKELHQEIEDFLKGKVNVNEIKKNIEDKFNTSKFNASRLVETEVSRVHDEYFRKYCKDNGIDKVIYKATFCHTCKICSADNNKIFNIEDAPRIPRHPHCNCYLTYNLDNMEYMSNRFVPKYKDSKINMLGKECNKKKVINSEFDMWTDIDVTSKNKAIRLYEKKIRKIQADLPNDFKMPRFIIMDFEKNGINPNAIGGYAKEEKTLYLNSKYNTNKKIEDFLKINEGFFANINNDSALLHELGHKYHYYIAEKIANKNNISYTRAKDLFDDSINQYILNQSSIPRKYIDEQLSGYASDEFKGQDRINEIMAEYFTIKNTKNKSDLVKFIDEYINEVINNEAT